MMSDSIEGFGSVGTLCRYRARPYPRREGIIHIAPYSEKQIRTEQRFPILEGRLFEIHVRGQMRNERFEVLE